MFYENRYLLQEQSIVLGVGRVSGSILNLPKSGRCLESGMIVLLKYNFCFTVETIRDPNKVVVITE